MQVVTRGSGTNRTNAKIDKRTKKKVTYLNVKMGKAMMMSTALEGHILSCSTAAGSRMASSAPRYTTTELSTAIAATLPSGSHSEVG